MGEELTHADGLEIDISCRDLCMRDIVGVKRVRYRERRGGVPRRRCRIC